MSYFYCGCDPELGICEGNLPVGGGDTTNNYWFREGVNLLTTMTRQPTPQEDGTVAYCWDTSDVIYAIERNEKAREGLLRITQCKTLIHLANTISSLPTRQADDGMTSKYQSPIPYYTLFRGNFQGQ